MGSDSKVSLGVLILPPKSGHPLAKLSNGVRCPSFVKLSGPDVKFHAGDGAILGCRSGAKHGPEPGAARSKGFPNRGRRRGGKQGGLDKFQGK